MNKQELASKIWDSANKMRSKIEAHEYKDYILGFIFYKFLSDREVKFLKNHVFTDTDIKNLTEDDEETKKFIQKNIGYFIAYENLFSTWIEKGSDFDVSDVSRGLSAFSRLIGDSHKKVFSRILHTLETGLSKLGDSSGLQTKAISELIQLIKSIPMDGKQDYDVIGFIYEYLIGMFAANAGKKAGEFYTPHEVSLLMSEIVAEHLKDREKIKIYDPTSGSGSLLINIGCSIAKYMKNENGIQYYAQELKENTYNLTRMNLIMRGILPSNIVTRNGDTLEEDWPYFDESNKVQTYDPLYVDAVVSNPPYSQKWDSTNKESDPRYAPYGMAPKSKADFAFLLHDLYHLKPDGVMAIVLPHGVLFRGGEEGRIRKNLIERNHIDTIIGLPANIFFGTGIPTTIIILKQKRKHSDVLIVDASKGFIKVGKSNQLQASNIKKIVDVVIHREEIDSFSRVVTQEEIRNNDYNLNIPRYVDSSDKPETWDIYATMFGGIPKSEVNQLKDFWVALPNLRTTLFTDDGTPYVKLVTGDIKQAIINHHEVKRYIENFNLSFENFTEFLKLKLIDNMKTGVANQINIAQEQMMIGNDIFTRLESIPLIDKYTAYQIFDEKWQKTSLELEIIQSEGFEAVKKVKPNMVLKKKDGKEKEIQEGWVGHILPFDLIQNTLLKNEVEKLKQKENRLIEIATELEEMIDSLSDEERNLPILNDNNDAFVATEIAKEIKLIAKTSFNEDLSSGDFLEAKIIKVAKLLAENKELKLQIKKDSAKLHLLTKTTIEGLTDAQAKDLLTKKWITPLVAKINDLPQQVIHQLVNNLQKLADKYSVTYMDIATQIKDSENELSALIDGLVGNEFDMLGLQEFKSLLKGG